MKEIVFYLMKSDELKSSTMVKTEIERDKPELKTPNPEHSSYQRVDSPNYYLIERY